MASHPEIHWGVTLDKKTAEKGNDTTYICYSVRASQFLSFWVRDELYCRVFALQSKEEEAKLKALGKRDQENVKLRKEVEILRSEKA